ncbi:uncharacterized protein UHOD_06507 [Ustilago sp. UG-2017b]|nr:uncharacterized protein UHOD_06507 [Ustilago sp. UG-2017b]
MNHGSLLGGPHSARGRSAHSWPYTGINRQRNQGDHRSDSDRRWSSDEVSRPNLDSYGLAGCHRRTSSNLARHQQTLPTTGARRKASLQHEPDLARALRQSQPSDSLHFGSLSPAADARRLSGSPIRAFPNSPLVLDADDWSFLSSYLQSSPDSWARLPRSPLTGRGLSSSGAYHDHTTRSPLFQASGVDSWQMQNAEEGSTHQLLTPTTARPGSAGLDTIIEGASVDHDVSLADTSAFVFDRYRFSSVSTRSEPIGISPCSSPVPATQSGVLTGRTSRESSAFSDASSHGIAGGFRPKPLILRHHSRSTDPIARASSRLWHSTSVPMLMLETTPTESSPRFDRPDTSRSETAGSPSLGRDYLTPTLTSNLTLGDAIVSAPPEVSRRDWQAERLDPSQVISPRTTHTQANLATKGPRTSRQADCNESESVTPRTREPATINVSGPSSFTSVIVQDDNFADQSREELPLPILEGSSPLSPTKALGNTTPRKSQSSSDADPDQSLRSESLSPPRSAASAETRSSGTVELVPWQVATTDSVGPRRSEEIFRPLSMAMSMSRSGAGSSRDTITSRTARQTAAAAEAGSYRTTFQMPGTPLKGGTDFIWGRAEYEARSSRETAGSNAGTGSRRPSHVGLGFSVPRPSITLQQNSSPYPDADPNVGGEQIHSDSKSSQAMDSRERLTRGYRISSPSGAMKRLLFELEHGSKDSQLARAAQPQDPSSHEASNTPSTEVADATGAHHQRSATLSSISILPRTSSIRRRHQSIDVDGRQRSTQASDLGAVSGLDILSEDPGARSISSNATQQPKAKDEHSHRAEDEADVSDSMPARIAKRAIYNSGLRVTLQLYTAVHQALFFAFESPYLWTSISPALPLVAAAFFLVLDTLIVRMYMLRGEQKKLFISFIAVLTLAMAYCSAMCAFKIVLLTRTADLGASSPGIHFHRGRSQDGNAFQQVLRDMPLSAVLFLLGVESILLSLPLLAAMILSHSRPRKQHPN